MIVDESYENVQKHRRLIAVAGASLLGGLVWIYPPHVLLEAVYDWCRCDTSTDVGRGPVKPAAFYITKLMRRELGRRSTLALPRLDFFRTNSHSGMCAPKYFTLVAHGMRVSFRVMGRWLGLFPAKVISWLFKELNFISSLRPSIQFANIYYLCNP